MMGSNPEQQQHRHALFYGLLEEYPQAGEELEALTLSRVAHLLPELERVTPQTLALDGWEQGDWSREQERQQAWALFRAELEVAVTRVSQAELTDWVARWVRYPALYGELSWLAREYLGRMVHVWAAQPLPPMPALPDLRDYRILIRNLRGEGYGKIARAMQMSKDAVTKAAQRLKREMGLTLVPNPPGRPSKT